VLLVTKAVGDFLGTHGIADEIIRFNGFPFLEKEDHAFNVPGVLFPVASIVGRLVKSLTALVSSVTRKDLHTLRVSGMSVREVGQCVHFCHRVIALIITQNQPWLIQTSMVSPSYLTMVTGC
jgi:hypothetical protein